MTSAIEKPTQTHRKKKVGFFLSSRPEQNQRPPTDTAKPPNAASRSSQHAEKSARRFAAGGSIHPPLARGRSIISSSSFQDLGFGYLAPPFVGAADFWFPISWAPNPVPMVLSDAPNDFRSIPMFSHPGSNLSAPRPCLQFVANIRATGFHGW